MQIYSGIMEFNWTFIFMIINIIILIGIISGFIYLVFSMIKLRKVPKEIQSIKKEIEEIKNRIKNE